VNASGVKLAEHGWWGRNRHHLPRGGRGKGEGWGAEGGFEQPVEEMGYWERRAAEKEAEEAALAHMRTAPREPEDPLPPSRPTADETLLLGTPVVINCSCRAVCQV
jgi:hypothetical protein